MANWTTLTFAANTLLTSLKLDQMVENLTAFTEGSSGTPIIQSNGISSGTISLDKFKVVQASVAGTLSSSAGSVLSRIYFSLNAYAFFPHTMVFSAQGGGFFPADYALCCSSGSAGVVGSADVPEFMLRRLIGVNNSSALVKYHYIDVGSF
jgi:hypothetical protein